jgi:hypothetical protein
VITTAARASFLAAFTIGTGYSADADYSPRAWLMHRTGITRAAAVGHTAWATRAAVHPKVLAALAAGELSESYGRAICRWTDTLPEKYRAESDELLIAAARQRLAAGQGELDLGLDAGAAGGPLPISASRTGCLLDALEHSILAIVKRLGLR